eukprot:CCRYP_011835-RB/>CCRYP_011835-RB protein AED:0.27 eAED:0.27 QI:353/1/1/1/0/0/2/209/593
MPPSRFCPPRMPPRIIPIVILAFLSSYLASSATESSSPSSIHCHTGSSSPSHLECTPHTEDDSWLNHEMDQIAWPAPPSNDSLALLSAVQSFFASNPTHDDNVPTSKTLQTSIRDNAERLQPTLVTIRRLLHRHPELMYQERLTGQIVRRLLHEMGIENVSVGWGKNVHSKFYNSDGSLGDNQTHSPHVESDEYDGGGFGVVVDIGSGEPPCVLLRADMDALPIVEKTPLPPDLEGEEEAVDLFRSRHYGKMHACGHDAHMTMLLGAVYLIQSLKLQQHQQQPHQLPNSNKYAFPGTIRIIFQPAEEGGAGAKRMSEEGVLLRHPPPSYAFAMHVWPTLPSGEIGFRSGPMLAAADMFTLHIEGVGGHAAFPHLVVDPIVAASSIVLNVQTLVSRGMNPLESGVVSVTQVEAGDGAFNVIPARAVLRGTIRALSDEALLKLRRGLVRIAENTAVAHGCVLTSSTFSKDNYPVTINDGKLYPFAARVAGMVAKGGQVTNVNPTMGAEDFAFLAQGVPSAFFFLGQGGNANEDGLQTHVGTNCAGICKSGVGKVPTNLGLHHPEFNLDEDVMSKGVELFVNLALRALHEMKIEAS